MRKFLLALLLLIPAAAFAQVSQTVTLSAAGVSGPMPTGTPQHPMTTAGETLLLQITGTATCTVQVTGDNPLVQINNWYNHDILTSQTATAVSNLKFPVTAVRLNCASINSGTASLTLVNF